MNTEKSQEDKNGGEEGAQGSSYKCAQFAVYLSDDIKSYWVWDR